VPILSAVDAIGLRERVRQPQLRWCRRSRSWLRRSAGCCWARVRGVFLIMTASSVRGPAGCGPVPLGPQPEGWRKSGAYRLIGAGQNRSSSERSRLAIATLAATRSDFKTLKRRAQHTNSVLVMGERRAQKLQASRTLDQHVVLLRRSINPRAVTHRRFSPPVRTIRQRPNPEVPLRVLMDKALNSGAVPGPGRVDVLETARLSNVARAAVLLQPAPHGSPAPAPTRS
jgi:hypothetical protein